MSMAHSKRSSLRFVPDTEGVQVGIGTLTGVGIHRDVTDEFQRVYTFYLAKTTVRHNLLRALLRGDGCAFTAKTTVLHDLLRVLALDSYG